MSLLACSLQFEEHWFCINEKTNDILFRKHFEILILFFVVGNAIRFKSVGRRHWIAYNKLSVQTRDGFCWCILEKTAEIATETHCHYNTDNS